MRQMMWFRFLLRLADVRILYAAFGVVFSVNAHELFHVLVHIDEIYSVRFFTDWATLVAMHVGEMSSNALMTEELIAYSITIVILLITAIDIITISDHRNDKSLRATRLHNKYIFANFDDTEIEKVIGVNRSYLDSLHH